MNRIEKFYVAKNISDREIKIDTGQFKVGHYDYMGFQGNEIQVTFHIQIPEIKGDKEKAEWVCGKLNEDRQYNTNSIKYKMKEELESKFKEITDKLKVQIVQDLQLKDFIGGKDE